MNTSMNPLKFCNRILYYIIMFGIFFQFFAYPVYAMVEHFPYGVKSKYYIHYERPNDYLNSVAAERTETQEVSAKNTVSKTKHVTKSYRLSAPSKATNLEETAIEIFSQDKSGTIGYANNSNSDDPSDNIFSFNIEKQILAGKEIRLSYEVYGIENVSGISRSINENSATGGYLVKKNSQWNHLEETISLNQLKNGVNHLLFTAFENKSADYKVKNVSIKAVPATQQKLVALADGAVVHTKDNKAYLKGSVLAGGFDLYVNNEKVAVKNNEFEAVVMHNSGTTQLDLQLKKQGVIVYSETVQLTEAAEAAVHSFKKAQGYSLIKELDNKSYGFTLEEVGFNIKKESYEKVEQITVQKLRTIDLAPMGTNIINVTQNKSGYRFLPEGAKFKDQAQVTVKFDKALLPSGYNANDVKILYFDIDQRRWLSVPTDTIIADQGKVVGLTDHFTDYIAGIIQSPESPETSSFTPTSISDIQVANPTANIMQVQPPTANQKGDGTLNFPITIPAGRNGMQPNLSLYYNNNGSSSIVGYGWDMSYPYISVDTKYGVPEYDLQRETESYLLNGEELLMQNGSGYYLPHRTGSPLARNGSGAKTFFPKVEGSFSKIERYGNSPSTYYWIVWDKSGTKYYYDMPLRASSGSSIGKWYLTRVEDKNGNYTQYSPRLATYPNGNIGGGVEMILDHIYYTMNQNFGGVNDRLYYKVSFTYDNNTRTDAHFNYRLGFKEVNAQKLRLIKVSCYNNFDLPDDEVHCDHNVEYHFNYSTGKFGKTLLNGITTRNIKKDDGNTVAQEDYTHNFEYYDDLGGGGLFGAAETISVADDISGDKHSVLSSTIETYNTSEVNVGAGISPAANPPVWFPFSFSGTINFAFPSKSSTSSNPTMMLLDMDGDGLDDKVVKIGNEIKYHKNLGGAMFSSILYKTYNIGNLGWNETDTKSDPERSISIIAFNFNASKSQTNSRSRTYFTDVNGDGLVDYIKDKIVYFNRIDPNTGTPNFTTDSSITPNVVIKDEDADPEISEPLPDLSQGSDLMDIVKVWVAPKKGTVEVSGAISKAYVSSNNGVRYSVELSKSGNDIDYWAPSFPVSNVSLSVPTVPWDPNDIPTAAPIAVNYFTKSYIVDPRLLITATQNVSGTVQVDPGDHIYFRVNSSQVPYEKVNVNWDPEVKYVGETTSRYSDAYLYGNSVLEPLMVTEPGNYVFEWDNHSYGQLNGSVNIVARAYKLQYNSTTQQADKVQINTSNLVNFLTTTVSNNTTLANPNRSFNLTSVINPNDPNTYVYFEIEVTGDKNRKIDWKAFDNGFKPRLRKTGTTPDNRSIVPKYDMYNHSLTDYSISTMNSSSGTVYIKNNFSLPACQGKCQEETITLIVTSPNGTIPLTANGMLAKFEYKINSSGTIQQVRQFSASLPNTSVVITAAQSSMAVGFLSQYNFDYYTDSYRVASALNHYQNSNNLIMLNSTPPAYNNNGSFFSFNRPNITTRQPQESGLGTLYKNWGQFGYKGANPDEDFIPIEQSYISRLALSGVADPGNPSNDEKQMYGALDGLNVDDIDYDFNTGTFTASGNTLPINQNQMEAISHFTILKSNRNINAWSMHDRLYAGSTEMSPYLRYDNANINKMAPIPAPSNVGSYGAVAVVKESTSESKSKGRSVGFYGISLGKSESNGTSKQMNDFFDVNGDGYPDIIGNKIQLTTKRGGLSNNFITKNLLFTTTSIGSGKSTGGSAGHITALADEAGRLAGFKIGASNSFSQNIGGGVNTFNTFSSPERALVDLNGDGLVDLVTSESEVEFNKANDFVPSSWSGFSKPKESKTVSQGLSGNFGVPLNGFGSSNLDLSFGVSGSTSTTYSTKDFVDFNGDGLPDYISEDGSGKRVSFNYGTYHGGSISVPKLNESSSSSIGANINASVLIPITIPIPFFPLVLKLGGGGGVSTGKTFNEENVSFRDFDGDGYVDMVESTTETELNVSFSRIRRTNMLKKVINPTGSTIEMDYATDNVVSKTSFGPNYKMPFKKWVLSKVKVNDGFTGDGENTQSYAFEYQNGLKDRRERKFLGFGEVKTYQLMNNGSIYRYNVQKYMLDDMTTAEIYLPGNHPDSRKYQYIGSLLKSDKTYSGTNVVLNETNYDYALYRLNPSVTAFNTASVSAVTYEDVCRILPLVKSTQSTVYHYKNGYTSVLPYVTTALFKNYDKYGNVTAYTDPVDNVDVNITYHIKDFAGSQYNVSTPATHKVDNYKRYSTTTVDNIGNVTEIKRYRNYASNSSDVAVTNLEYDNLGNLTKVTLPAPVAGGSNRMFYEYEYDYFFKKQVTKVTDAYGYESSTTYNHFGMPLTQTDLNGVVFTNTYDAMNRLVQFKGPYSGEWTIRNEYKKMLGSNLRYAVTKHNILDEYVTVGEQVLHTSSFADGLGRIVQTKKQLENPCGASGFRFAVSGMQKYDEFGRTVESYLGQEESDCGGVFQDALETYSNLTHVVNEKTTMAYDVRDRVLQSHVYGLNATTKYEYGFDFDAGGTQYATEKVILPEGNIAITYKDVKGRVRTSSQIDQQGMHLPTFYQYNNIGEVTHVSTSAGQTLYQYDNFGQKTQVNHPDSGISKFEYDLTGKLLKSTTQNLINAGNKWIIYNYNLNQLTDIEYPDYTDGIGTYYPAHTVKYEYGGVGAAYLAASRITRIEDLTGEKFMKYGKLGEVIEENRILSSQNGSMAFNTKYRYDSWGRIMQMIYPDNEIVTYGYNSVGQLLSIASADQEYLKDVQYNFFDQPTEITYGNDVVTKNEYDITQRIRAMQIDRPGNSPLMRNVYSYDRNQNITQIKNNVSQHNVLQIGGVFDKTYQYDDFNRLKFAEGIWLGAGEDHNYRLHMAYNNTHGILSKNQTHLANNTPTENYYDANYQYGNSAHPNAVSRITYSNLQGGGNATSDFDYDANGNLKVYTTNFGPFSKRTMSWDTQNRLSAVIDNDSQVSHYVYDHAGERTFKAVGDINTINIGGGTIYSVADFNQYTLYPSGYMVVDPVKDEYSKHYYINGKRFASRLLPDPGQFHYAGKPGAQAQNQKGMANGDGVVLNKVLNVQNITYSITIGNDPANCLQQIEDIYDIFEAANTAPLFPTQHCLDFIDDLKDKVADNAQYPNYGYCEALVELNAYTCTPVTVNNPDPQTNPELTPGQIAENDCLTELNILMSQLFTKIEETLNLNRMGGVDQREFDCNVPYWYPGNCCIELSHGNWDGNYTQNGKCKDCPEITLVDCGLVPVKQQTPAWLACMRNCMENQGGYGVSCIDHFEQTGEWYDDCFYLTLNCEDCQEFVDVKVPPINVIECLRGCGIAGVSEALEYYDQTGSWKPEYDHFITDCGCDREEPGEPGPGLPGPEVAACLKDCAVPGARELYENYREYGEWLPGYQDIINQCNCKEGMENTDPNCPLEAYLYIQNNLVLQPQSNACAVYEYVIKHFNCVTKGEEEEEPTTPIDIDDEWEDEDVDTDQGTDGPYNEDDRRPIWWYHTDHLGSSTYLTDNFGRPSHYYETLPFGEMMVEHNQSANVPSGVGYDNKYKFNGKELDDATQMYYYGARYYDPRISIFVSVDPLAEDFVGWTPYHYVHNNPINLIDPTGMSAQDPEGGGFWNNVRSFLGMGSSNKQEASPIEETVLDEVVVSANRKPNWFQRNKDNLINFISDFGGGSQIMDTHSQAMDGATRSDGSVNWTSYSAHTLWLDKINNYGGDMGSAATPTLNRRVPLGARGGGLGNPFKNMNLSQIDNVFQTHVKSGKMIPKPGAPGSKVYQNVKSGYSYNLDPGGVYGKKVEGPHIDVNYSKPKPKNIPKKKLPVSGGF